MDTNGLRKMRNRLIYQECLRRCIDAPDQPDMARFVRGDACVQVTMQTRGVAVENYDKLTLEELQFVIEYLRDGRLPPKRARFASNRKMGLLHNIAMKCAVHYADFPTCINEDGVPISSLEIKTSAVAALQGRGRMPHVAQKALYDWINPQIIKMADSYEFGEGEPNPVRKSSQFVQWNRFSDDFCQHLINRFQNMYSEITQRYNKQGVE